MDVDDSRLYRCFITLHFAATPIAVGCWLITIWQASISPTLRRAVPLFVRHPNSSFTLSNFMRSHLYAALATFRIGLDHLLDQEGVVIRRVLGHGGFFKTEGLVSGSWRLLNAPVDVMETAGEGGAWGIALLAAYQPEITRGHWNPLLMNVFLQACSAKLLCPILWMSRFSAFMERFKAGLRS